MGGGPSAAVQKTNKNLSNKLDEQAGKVTDGRSLPDMLHEPLFLADGDEDEDESTVTIFRDDSEQEYNGMVKGDLVRDQNSGPGALETLGKIKCEDGFLTYNDVYIYCCLITKTSEDFHQEFEKKYFGPKCRHRAVHLINKNYRVSFRLCKDEMWHKGKKFLIAVLLGGRPEDLKGALVFLAAHMPEFKNGISDLHHKHNSKRQEIYEKHREWDNTIMTKWAKNCKELQGLIFWYRQKKKTHAKTVDMNQKDNVKYSQEKITSRFAPTVEDIVKCHKSYMKKLPSFVREVQADCSSNNVEVEGGEEEALDFVPTSTSTTSSMSKVSHLGQNLRPSTFASTEGSKNVPISPQPLKPLNSIKKENALKAKEVPIATGKTDEFKTAVASKKVDEAGVDLPVVATETDEEKQVNESGEATETDVKTEGKLGGVKEKAAIARKKVDEAGVEMEDNLKSTGTEVRKEMSEDASKTRNKVDNWGVSLENDLKDIGTKVWKEFDKWENEARVKVERFGKQTEGKFGAATDPKNKADLDDESLTAEEKKQKVEREGDAMKMRVQGEDQTVEPEHSEETDETEEKETSTDATTETEETTATASGTTTSADEPSEGGEAGEAATRATEEVNVSNYSPLSRFNNQSVSHSNYNLKKIIKRYENWSARYQ